MIADMPKISGQNDSGCAEDQRTNDSGYAEDQWPFQVFPGIGELESPGGKK